VDSQEEKEFQRMVKRLIKLITLYEEHLKKKSMLPVPRSRNPSILASGAPPLPPRRSVTTTKTEKSENRISEWVSDIPLGAIPRSLSTSDAESTNSTNDRTSADTNSPIYYEQDEILNPLVSQPSSPETNEQLKTEIISRVHPKTPLLEIEGKHTFPKSNREPITTNESNIPNILEIISRESFVNPA
jgi:hypothetical protein